MTEEVLESFTRQYLGISRYPEVVFSWQGGEPTLAGLEFFQRAIVLQEKYCPPGKHVINTLQTNGTFLTDEWCRFFHRHNFLIGISLDGPCELHNAYRVDKLGRPTFDRVMTGVELLKKHGVDFNVLTTVNAINTDHPLEVYRFLRDEVDTQFIQFIPIVEWVGMAVSGESITGEAYGSFLIEIFDEWVRRDVGRVYVQIFDVALAAWVGLPPGLCVFDETCGYCPVLEHSGDLYPCDFYVTPEYRLGNITDVPLTTLLTSDKMAQFGLKKRDTLACACKECEVRFVCNGGCPRNRFHGYALDSQELGLNYLCNGYKASFTHISAPMQFMAEELQRGRAPANIMQYLRTSAKDRLTWEETRVKQQSEDGLSLNKIKR